jgi:hypothetical protein
MEAVDESVRLVQFSAQCRLATPVVSGATNRCSRVTALHGIELVRDANDLVAQLSKQCPCLSRPRVFNHLWIVSSIFNVRDAGGMNFRCSNL